MSGAEAVAKTPGKRRFHPAAKAALGLVVLAAAAHSGTWFYVTGRILDGIPAFTAQAAREGWTIRGGTPTRGGWPLAATVHVPALVAARPLGSTSFTWTAERLDLTIRPETPGVLRVAPGGDGAVRLGQAAPIPLRAETAEFTLPLDGVGPQSLDVSGLMLGTSAAGVTVARLQARIGTGAVAGTAGPVVVAPPFPAPFDSGATLTGRLVAAPPIPVAATPGQSAKAWQEAGGRATAPELLLSWGPLKVDGSIEGGLDPQLQPTAQARLNVTGALDVLDAASRAGVVQPGPAAAARAVLTLLTLAAKGGPVTLPVTLRDRTLTVAQFALIQLPPIAWDAP